MVKVKYEISGHELLMYGRMTANYVTVKHVWTCQNMPGFLHILHISKNISNCNVTRHVNIGKIANYYRNYGITNFYIINGVLYIIYIS